MNDESLKYPILLEKEWNTFVEKWGEEIALDATRSLMAELNVEEEKE